MKQRARKMAAPIGKGRQNRKTVKRKAPHKTVGATSDSKKSKDSPFNEIEFKYYLKESSTAFLGFEKFLQAATDWSDGAGEDIVQKYCRSSPECSEIFQVLEAGYFKIPQLQLVFSCLERILLRIADDLGHFYMSGQAIIKKLLAAHEKAIFNTLNVKNKSNQIKATLKLLVAMVMLGASSAKLVLNNIDIGHKDMLPLLQRRDVKDEEDVRTCFIHLIVACLLAKDYDVIRKLVQTKGLMENVFQGVEYERVGTLQLLMSTVLEKVIMNAGISKTTKVHMFSNTSLKQLGHLYNWQGLGKWKQSLKQKGKQNVSQSMEVDDVVNEDKVLVAELADQFLTEVCTSFKHGIIFHDTAYGLSGRNQNHLMKSLLGYLSGQLNHVLVQKLVIGILTACPDQLQYFFSHITHSLVPRETSKWISAMNFLMKIYQSLGKNISVLKSKEKKSVEDLVQILLVYTMPSSQVLNTILPGIKDKSLAVNHVSLRLVQQMADTAVQVLRQLDKLTMYSDQEKFEIRSTYKAFVLKNLPEVMSVFTCWDKVMPVQKANQEALNKLQDLCEAATSDVLTQIAQILCLYQELQHALLAEHPVILGKLIDGVMGSESTAGNCGKGHMTKVYLLKLMAGTETKRLPWAEQNASGQSLLYQVLDMMTQLSSSAELAGVTKELVCKLLEGTGHFQTHHDDLLVWIKSLQDSDPAVLDFVSMVMMTYIRNPYPYIDRLCDLDLQSDVTLETGQTKKLQINIKDIIAMDSVNMEEEKEEADLSSTGGKRFPFCPMLIVGLEMLEKLGTVPKVLQWYMSKVVLRTFNQQVNPSALCGLLTRYKTDLLIPGLYKYILAWTETDDSGSEGVLTRVRYEEFLSQNEDIVSPDVDPKSRIQQDLLHLTYLIQAWQKNPQKRHMKQLKSIKKGIVSSVKEISVAENEKNSPVENQGGDIHVQDLLVTENQNSVYSTISLVLNHPVSRQFFLLNEGVTGNQSEKITNIVTDMVTEMLEVIFERNIHLADQLNYYYQQIASALQSTTGNESVSRHSVLKVLTVSVSKFTADQCRQMLDLVLNAEVEDDEKEDTLLKPLLESLIQRLIKSDFKIAKLTEKGFGRLVSCFVSIEKPDEVLYKFFKRFPSLSSQCSARTLDRLIQSTQHCGLVQFLIENNSAVTSWIGEMIQSNDLDWSTSGNLQIVIRYLQSVIMDPECDASQWEPTASKIVKIYRSALLCLCEDSVVENSRQLTDLAALLVDNGLLGDKLIPKMKKRLSVTVQESAALKPHHIDLLCMVYSGDSRLTLVQIGMKCLIAVHGRMNTEGMCKEKEQMEDKLLDIIAASTQEEIQALSTWSELPDYWPQFMESSLKFAYTKSNFLKFITNILPVVHRQDDLDLGVTLEHTVAMVIGHSSFLSVMFKEKGQECQESMISLLLVLTQLCPSACHEDHIGAFLGSYGASLSMTDQRLLKLIHFYEKNEISFADYRPFLWGEKAVEQHALRQSLGPSLKRATMTQVMSNIDTSLMKQSILHFPLRRKLQDIEPQPADEYKSESKCYDPCFILPLISHLLGPECVIDCKRFILSGCLGYTLAALSSHDEDMRTAAQHILDKFQSHLGVTKIQEKEQLQYMLHVVKNSIPQTKNKLSSIITQFLARTTKLMLRPDDHMYTIINQFLLLKPSLDIGNIPEFFKLFNSSAKQYQTERSWILTLMSDGLREAADYWIYEKRFTFKLLMGFYHSKLADVQSQCQVLQILMSACSVRRLAKDLCQNHGFLIWIASAMNQLSPTKVQLCVDLCSILSKVSATMVDQSQEETKSVQISFSIQVLTCFKTMLLYIRNVPEDIKLQFLRNMSSVLSNLSSVEDKMRGHDTQTVTHTEVLLLLLHCQDHWTQSKCLTQSMKAILQALGLDLTVLEGTSSQSGKRNESAISEHGREGEADKDAVDEAEDNKNDQSDEKCLIVEEIVKILDLWKPSGDRRNEANSTVEVLVVQWILDQLDTTKSVQTIFCMVKLVHRLILDGAETRDSQVLAYISGENNTMATEILVDILNMYNAIEQKYYRMCTKHVKPLQPEMAKAMQMLNEVVSEIYRTKYNLSDIKVEKDVGKHLHRMKVCDETQALKSVVLRQIFVEKF